MQSQMERERQRLAIEERKAEEQRRLLEEQEKEKIRNEKRAAKERRREARGKEDLKKQQDRMKMSSSMSKESFNGQGVNNGTGNSPHQYNEYQAKKGFEYKEHNKRHTENGGWCRSLMMLLLALLLVTVGSGISLLFIYTGGHLDQQSIERALPVLQHDVEHTFVLIGKKVDFVWQEAHRILNPFWKKIAKNGSGLWDELVKNGTLILNKMKEQASHFLDYVYVNWGPAFCSVRHWCQLRLHELMNYASQLWDLSKPYIDQLVYIVVHYTGLLVEKTKEHFPVFIDSLSGQINYLWTSASASFSQLIGEN